MKRGLDQIEFDNSYQPSIVWDNKDIISSCISKFLTLDEKSKLSQTCRRLYTIFNENDKAIRFMCNIYRINELDKRIRRKCIATSGILECVKFGIENMNIYHLKCLKEIYKSCLFQHEDVISYLTFNNIFYFKDFSKMIYGSFDAGFFDFTCSLFENRNSKWMSKDYFNLLKIENAADIENIRKNIWDSLLIGESLEIIKKFESSFKKDITLESILEALYNVDLNVFEYIWNQAPITIRTASNVKKNLRDKLKTKTTDKIVYVLNLFFKDNPDVDVDYMLACCKERENLKYLIDKR